MASESAQKFAEELKLHRESKNISLHHIAAKTRIDLKFLQAMEEGNFDILPEIYIRAFIKEYAATIDLNPKEVMLKYDEAKSGRSEEKNRPDEIKKENEIGNREAEPVVAEAKKIERNFGTSEIETPPTLPQTSDLISKMKVNYLIGGAVVLIALVVLYFALFTGSSEIEQVKADNETVSNNADRFEINKSSQSNPAQNPQPVQAAPAMSKDSLYLNLKITDRVWIKVYLDGKVVSQRMEDANSNLKFAAKKNISVSIGNVTHTKVFVNNKPVENLGKEGEMKNLYITADGIKFYTIQPQKNDTKSPTKN